MQWWSALCVLVAARCAGGVTKTPSASGISQFWTDDYKVFEQVYGRTSDKELFGDLPSSSFGGEARLRNQASEKKELYLDNDGQNSDLDDEQLDPYGYGSRYPYNSLLAKEAIKALGKKTPTKTPLKFISADFKPISQSSDPETYNYLKRLEQLEKQKIEFHDATVGGFKPYLSYSGGNPEESDAYKSIQDILDAHEANKGGHKDDIDQVKLTYPPKNRNRGKKQKSRGPVNEKSKARCPSGRCRKRTNTSYRVYTRPYVRRIKHKIVYK